MNRHLKLALPVARKLLIWDQVQNEIVAKKQQAKSFYDSYAKIELPSFNIGDVYLKLSPQNRGKQWLYSHIQEIPAPCASETNKNNVNDNANFDDNVMKTDNLTDSVNNEPLKPAINQSPFVIKSDRIVKKKTSFNPSM